MASAEKKMPHVWRHLEFCLGFLEIKFCSCFRKKPCLGLCVLSILSFAYVKEKCVTYISDYRLSKQTTNHVSNSKIEKALVTHGKLTTVCAIILTQFENA